MRSLVWSLVVLVSTVWFGCAGRAPTRPMTVPEGQHVEVRGTHLFVKRMGAGEPIVVVHGGPVLEHGYLMSHLLPLAASHELVFYDQRLCGRSAPDVDPESVTLASFVDDIEALREALGLGRIHLMAHSFGGLLAMEYATRYPQHLRSLILLDSMPPSSAMRQREDAVLAEQIRDDIREQMNAVRESEAFARREVSAIAELLRLSFASQFHDPAQLDRLELTVPADYLHRSRQFAAMGPDLTEFDLTEGLRAVAAPTLVLYGEDEPAIAVGETGWIDAMPSAELATIPAAGHFPFIEQPAAFLKRVRAFLGDV